METVIFEHLREDTIKQFEAYLIPSNELFMFLSKQNLEHTYQGESDYLPTQDVKDGIIVVVHWIGSFIQSCFFP